MLRKDTLYFLKNLKENNDRNWFHKKKDNYEIVKENFWQIVEILIEELQILEPLMKGISAKDCLFRIYRDVRFSKNKLPYQAHLSASIKIGGRKSPYVGYYIRIAPDNQSLIGGGAYAPAGPALKAIRQEIDYNQLEFEAILENADFKKHFGTLQDKRLKTTPRGFSKDHPAIDWLRLKSFTAFKTLSDEEVLSNQLIENSLTSFKALKDLIDFLNKAMDLPMD